MTQQTTPQNPKDERLERFRLAARAGDIAVLRSLVERGFDPGVQLRDEALLTAARSGELEAVKMLLRAGANPNAVSPDGETPAYVVAKGTLVIADAILRTLLEAGANPNGAPARGRTPLWAAVVAGKEKLVDLLLSAGASIKSTQPKSGRNLFHQCVTMGRFDLAQKMLDAGIPIDAGDADGRTAIHLTIISFGDESTIRWLLERGANLEARALDDYTPLLKAADQCKVSAFALLVRLGADPLARSAGMSALDLALTSAYQPKQKDAMVLHLLQHHPALVPTGADLNVALAKAVRGGCMGAVCRFAELGADVRQKPEGRTLLQHAPSGEKGEEMRRLLRSLQTSQRITSAMEDTLEQPASAPTRSLTL